MGLAPEAMDGVLQVPPSDFDLVYRQLRVALEACSGCCDASRQLLVSDSVQSGAPEEQQQQWPIHTAPVVGAATGAAAMCQQPAATQAGQRPTTNTGAGWGTAPAAAGAKQQVCVSVRPAPHALSEAGHTFRDTDSFLG